ncbi:MAG: bifunctional phosphopantothenoylcysteine decarboxylase/phosphopantothenate--cysteine ligase CoaBC [Euryarchaeota archaeon]|nr:bifunctional phosphopantothenoylcysteine decarboxylase/phosphopantothenate--cysteine ligase CoaBC [Euryarchaeota archaeon]
MTHPSDLIKGSKGRDLEGKKIIYCITGSIASVESVKIIRELIRYGADVIPFMTKGALRVITPEALHFASGHEPVYKFSGETEHIKYVKYSDGVIIAPATANIIGKIANGIADDVVSTAALVAIGSNRKILLAPVMDITMLRNPVVQENLKKLERLGVRIISPKIEEDKAKIPDKEDIIKEAIRTFGKGDLKGRHILILSGATAEHIDDVRVLTNLSSGKMGYWIAKRAYLRGADVDMVYALGTVDPSRYANVYRVTTVKDMLNTSLDLLSKNDYDVVISVAAISDYRPKRIVKGKIPSGIKDLKIELEPTPKVVEEIRKVYDGLLVIFKTEPTTGESLINKAKRRMEDIGADIVVANPITAFSADSTEVYIIKRGEEPIYVKGPKSMIAEELLNVVSKSL